MLRTNIRINPDLILINPDFDSAAGGIIGVDRSRACRGINQCESVCLRVAQAGESPLNLFRDMN